MPGHSCNFGEGITAQAMTDLAKPGLLGVRELELPFQLGLQDAVFGGQIFMAPHWALGRCNKWSNKPTL